MLFSIFSATAQKQISKADKQALITMFKDVPPSKYRLQFSKREVYGKKRVTMQDLKILTSNKNNPNAAGWIVVAVEGDDVIMVFAVGDPVLKSTLGNRRHQQLKRIMAKYN